MKHFFILLMLSASLHTTVNAQSASPKSTMKGSDETMIRQLLDEQTLAWNRGDIESFMNGYWVNDSLMFIGKSGVTYGWINTLNNYKKGYPDTASLKQD